MSQSPIDSKKEPPHPKYPSPLIKSKGYRNLPDLPNLDDNDDLNEKTKCTVNNLPSNSLNNLPSNSLIDEEVPPKLYRQKGKYY